jgi:DNA-binding response OmpR family regulator
MSSILLIEDDKTIRLALGFTLIIMLTALDQETDKVAGLDAGADDNVTKPFSMAELLARVRANMRRRMESGAERPSQIDVGELYMDLDAARVLVTGDSVKLRKKEYQVLFALASRPGVLCTRQWLSKEVWGEAFLPTRRRASSRWHATLWTSRAWKQTCARRPSRPLVIWPR